MLRRTWLLLLAAAVHPLNSMGMMAGGWKLMPPPQIDVVSGSSSSIKVQCGASRWASTHVQRLQDDGSWITVAILAGGAQNYTLGGLMDGRNHSVRICNGSTVVPAASHHLRYNGNCSRTHFLSRVALGQCKKILEHMHHTAPSAAACCQRCAAYKPAWGACGAWTWEQEAQPPAAGVCTLFGGNSDCVRVNQTDSVSGLMQLAPGPPPLPPAPVECSNVASTMTPAATMNPRGMLLQKCNATFPRGGEGTIVRDGARLFYFFGLWLHAGDLGESLIAYKTSDNSGHSWSDEPVLLTPTDGKGRANVGAVVLSPGHILISYFVSANQSAYRVIRRSTDGGKTFGAERLLTDGSYSYMTGAHDRLRQLSSGRLAITVHVKVSTSESGNGELCTLFFYSDSQGETWERFPVCLNVTGARQYTGQGRNEGFLESAFVELGGAESQLKGHLLMLGRTSTGWLAQSKSSDFGATWSDPVVNTEMRHPEAPPNVARLNDGSLLLVTEPHFNPSQTLLGTRFILATQLSTDQGNSWRHYRNLQFTGKDASENSYCSIFVDAGDIVHFTHYRVHQAHSFRNAQYVRLNMSSFEAS
jgi:hypothetical protein